MTLKQQGKNATEYTNKVWLKLDRKTAQTGSENGSNWIGKRLKNGSQRLRRIKMAHRTHSVGTLIYRLGRKWSIQCTAIASKRRSVTDSHKTSRVYKAV